MPVRRTAEEQDQLDEESLRRQRLKLQKEIEDNVRYQQQVYEEVMKPNAADAKLLQAQVKGGAYNGVPVTLAIATALHGIDTPTARFEWSRAEIDRVSKLVTSKRGQLKKVEEKLEMARGRRNRAARLSFTREVVKRLATTVGR